MSLTLYGAPRSRTFRVIWMLEELGLPYVHHFAYGEQLREPGFLAVAPQGRIPVLVDGDLVLTESLAINLHLARRAGAPFWPEAEADRSRALVWTLFAATELDNPLTQWISHTLFLPEEKRVPAQAAAAAATLVRPLGDLDRALAQGSLVPGQEFTIADLNVAGTLFSAIRAGMPVPELPAFRVWFERMVDRPAARRAIAARVANRPVAELEGAPA